MYHVKKSHQHSCSCMCVCVYVHVGRRGLAHHSLYVNSNKLLHLSESPKVPLVSFLMLAMYTSLRCI